MKYLILFAAIIAVCLTYTCKYPARDVPIYPAAPPKYDINLDLPYKEKWRALITEKKENLTNVVEYVKYKFHIPFFIDYLPYSWVHKYNPDLAEEILAISELSEISFGVLFSLNLIYESSAFCTAVLAQSENGTLIHTWNLDYQHLTEYISILAYEGHFYRGGKLLYKGSTYAGYAGVLGGVKPGKFAITVDQRNTMDRTKILSWVKGLFGNIYSLIWDRKPSMSLAVRKTFEEAESYKQAVEMLGKIDVLAPVYYAVSGTKENEACLMSKHREQVDAVSELDNKAGIWYIAHTNYDRDWVDPPEDNRRTAAEDRLNELSQAKLSKEGIRNIMQLFPTFSNNTISTLFVSAQEGTFDSTIYHYNSNHHCPEPKKFDEL